MHMEDEAHRLFAARPNSSKERKKKTVTNEIWSSNIWNIVRMMDSSSLFYVGLFKAIVKFSLSRRIKNEEAPGKMIP